MDELQRAQADLAKEQAKHEKAKANQIKADVKIKVVETFMKWTAIWLVITGVLKIDVIREVIKWIN